MSYTNRDQSGTVMRTPNQKKDPVVERVMMIAERLVALEKKVAEIEKKVKWYGENFLEIWWNTDHSSREEDISGAIQEQQALQAVDFPPSQSIPRSRTPMTDDKRKFLQETNFDEDYDSDKAKKEAKKRQELRDKYSQWESDSWINSSNGLRWSFFSATYQE